MKIETYALTVQLQCECGTSYLLIGQVGQESDCPNCNRFVRLDGFAWEPEHKNIRLAMTHGVVEKQPEPTNVTDFVPETPGTPIAGD